MLDLSHIARHADSGLRTTGDDADRIAGSAK